jgi:hypothetical protein
MSDPMDIEPLSGAPTAPGAAGYRDSGRLKGPMCRQEMSRTGACGGRKTR